MDLNEHKRKKKKGGLKMTLDVGGEPVLIGAQKKEGALTSFKDWQAKNQELQEGRDNSNKVKAMTTLTDALKHVFSEFDIATRKFVWERLNSPKGEALMQRILRYPHTKLSDSEFRKLVE